MGACVTNLAQPSRICVEILTYQPGFSPSLTSFAIQGGWSAPLLRIDFEVPDPLQLAPIGRDAAWSPDGKMIAFLDEGRRIHFVQSDGSNPHLLIPQSGNNNLAWSPNSEMIAFDSLRTGNAEIYITHADGSGQNRISFHDYLDIEPSWSPDGTKLAYLSAQENNRREVWGDLFVVSPDGTDRV